MDFNLKFFIYSSNRNGQAVGDYNGGRSEKDILQFLT